MESSSKEYHGEVQIYGNVFLGQFYSLGGQSDADTVKIDITPDSVRFRKTEKDEWQEDIQVLNDAYYIDQGRRKPVIRKTENYSYIRIRLQGIDAPELHYSAIADDIPLNSEQRDKFESFKDIKYRQYWGAKAAKELADFLKQYQFEENGKKYVKTYAFSKVDTPNDLFDKFGRAVCDIILSEPNIDVNQWLVENGWAFPDFYNSMSSSEIVTLKERGEQALNPHVGIRSSYSQELVPFNSDLTFNESDISIDIDNDIGDINLPKFFRKQVDHEVIKKCGVRSYPTLKDFIHFKNSKCYNIDDYLESRDQARIHELSEFITQNGSMHFEVGDLVYIESDAEVVDRDGKIINEWY